MLTRVQIKNFRCLRDIDVPLKPLTVLIGPNNTGKSAFLSAVQLLGKIPTHGDSAHKVKKSDIWQFDNALPVGVYGVQDGGRKVSVERGNANEPKADGNFWIRRGDNAQISPVSYFCSSAMIPAMTSKGAQGIPEVDDGATNVPAVLDSLLRKDRRKFDQILSSLKEYIPGFSDLNIETPSPDTRRIDLMLENGSTMEAGLASHGVKLMIFFVVLANHPTPPRLILIEEPETGVHPKRLRNIIKLLRGLVEGKYAEHRAQIVLSTHSPYLLDSIDPENDQVLVFERQQDGSRLANPIDTDRLSVFLDEFMLGEVWYSQDEAGLVEKTS